ncbi:endothelin-converting enzyme 2-like [Dermacentor silvarum]|uniref:endothelin-converting enzyme 2-like n=1 Tax=Dermacentor silvarum TaxID=543639 RepID=UPI002100784E|nr:endothelin-converting enzyme 2-like [Dermacentor silvarum]
MCLALTGLGVIVASVFAFSVKEELPTIRVCKSKACVEYSTRLRQSINTSMQPCRSFYRYVCDGWSKNVYSVREYAYMTALDRVTDLFWSVQVPTTNQTSQEQVAALYRSCDAVLKGKRNDLANAKLALSAAGIVWPHRPDKPDVLRLLLETSMTLGWDTVLHMEGGAKRNKIVLARGTSFPIISSKYEHLHTHVQKRIYFNALRDKFSLTGRDEVVDLDEMMSVSEDMTNALANVTVGQSAQMSITQSWLYEVRLNLSKGRFAKALKAYNVTVDDDATVILWDSDFVYAFVELWHRHGESMVHLYVSWCTVQVAALYADSDLIANYYSSRYRAHLQHGAFCLGRAQLFGGYATFSQYNALILNRETRADVERILLTMRSMYRGHLEKWNFVDAEKPVVANWTSLKTVLPNADQDEHGIETSEFDEGLLRMTDSFVDNWKKVMAHTRFSGGVFGSNIVTSTKLYALLPSQADFHFMPFAFSFPLYDYDLPTTVNYAGLGAQVAEAIGELLMKEYLPSDVVSAVLPCLAKAPSAQLKSASVSEIVSLAVLLTAFESDSAHKVRLGDFETYSPAQLLFISWCYMKCGGKYNSLPSACDAVLRHISNFADEFGCSPGDHLNPMHRCALT